MNSKLIAIITLLTLFAVTGCAEKVKGNGKIIEKNIQVSDFSALKIDGAIGSSFSPFKTNENNGPVFNYAQQPGDASLTIKIDENLYPLLTINSSKGELSIGVERGSQIIPTTFILNGSSTQLSKLRISGAIKFNLQSALSGKTLEVDVSGASNANMNQEVRIDQCTVYVSGAGHFKANNLECKTIDSSVSGAGNINLKGKATTGEFHVSGSGNIKAYDFVVQELDCKVSGSGNLKVHATETLNASASGSGNIQYKGNPRAETHTSGAGGINRSK